MKILCLVTFSLLVLSIGYTNAGFRIRVSRYRSSSSVRTTTYRRTSSTTRTPGISYTKALAAGYTINGLYKYRLRFSGTDDYNSDPTICYTTSLGLKDDGSYSKLGHYICPRLSTDSAEDTSCCGTSTRQTCCEPGYWDTYMELKIAGIVFGVIAFLAIPCIVCCVCKYKRKAKYAKRRQELSNARIADEISATQAFTGNGNASPMLPGGSYTLYPNQPAGYPAPAYSGNFPTEHPEKEVQLQDSDKASYYKHM